MHIGKLLIGLGLICDVAGTLFITLDAQRGQKENDKTFDFIAWILAYFASPRWQTEPVDPRAKKALEIDPSADPALAELQKRAKELLADIQTDKAAEQDALTGDIKKFRAKLESSRAAAKKRKLLIWMAISLVTLGGILEFIGGVLFPG